MSAGRITIEHDEQVAWITIENEARRNAMSLSMWVQLEEILDSLGAETRCIVLKGAGYKAFVSGADISEFAGMRRTPEDVAHYDQCADRAMTKLHEMAQPTVAMISGFCIGGGMALALCCDIRVASLDSTFAIPAARLGLGYNVSGLQNLLDAVNVPHALDMMFSADRYSAQQALQMGFINRVHPQAELLENTAAYAKKISRNAPLTIAAAKRAVRELTRRRSAPDFDVCEDMIRTCFASADYAEGIQAFTEKRDPTFQGC